MKDDLPTFDLPQRITSGRLYFGKSLSWKTDFSKNMLSNIIKKSNQKSDYSQ
jgi:hypothetical protein